MFYFQETYTTIHCLTISYMHNLLKLHKWPLLTCIIGVKALDWFSSCVYVHINAHIWKHEIDLPFMHVHVNPYTLQYRRIHGTSDRLTHHSKDMIGLLGLFGVTNQQLFIKKLEVALCTSVSLWMNACFVSR